MIALSAYMKYCHSLSYANIPGYIARKYGNQQIKNIANTIKYTRTGGKDFFDSEFVFLFALFR